MYKRIFLMVMDSCGVGPCPDQDKFGDTGSNTLKACSTSNKFNINTMRKLGLFNIDNIGLDNLAIDNPIGAYGKNTEKSMGKDTVTGHFEMMGTIKYQPFPTFPNGFPKEIIDEFEKRTGKKVLVNKPYSGTEVIKDYGEEQMKTGNLIVYTSADSVFQIAAHTSVVPLNDLYKYCEIARELLQGEYGVGRVIARPFNGKYPFTRTEDRKDYALVPPYNALNYLKDNKYDVIAMGRICDIYSGSGETEMINTGNNNQSMEETLKLQNKDFNGLAFINFEDFDMLYGHRNDVDGYANALTEFDGWLDKFINNMKDTDLLMITADHGNDPSTPSTDHSREHTPLLIYSKIIKSKNIGIRDTFADIGKTILDNFNIENDLPGTSIIDEIK